MAMYGRLVVLLSVFKHDRIPNIDRWYVMENVMDCWTWVRGRRRFEFTFFLELKMDFNFSEGFKSSNPVYKPPKN
jgi:hypothetical protein